MADHLLAESLSVSHGDVAALAEVDLPVARGKITVLAGPNGCGKSTLLRAIRRIHTAKAGRVLLEGTDISEMRERALALRIGLLAQSPSAPDDMTVEELVQLGRFPHRGLVQRRSAADAEAIGAAMDGTGMTAMKSRPLGTLSGGQLQRAWIAMVLAQGTEIVCLDEPVNHLDMAHQIDCLELVSELNRRHGRTVLLVLHDLNLAARYGDELVFMKEGRIAARGTPEALMQPELISEVFGIACQILRDEENDRPFCIPRRRQRA